MYTVIQMSGKFYAKKHSVNSEREVNEFMEYIEAFTSEGTAVTLCDEVDAAAELFDIDLSDIEIVHD